MKMVVDFLLSKEGDRKRDLVVLLVLFALFLFLFLGRFPLTEPDEGRYAEIPREMIELGDFITPHLNYVKYFEKPPLLYWLNALSFAVFGENEFGARFPSALCALLGILFTYHVGWKLFGRRTAILSALVLGSSVGYLALGRVTITDMVLTCCMTVALGSFILAVQDNEQRKGLYFCLFYASAALAVLAKGLIGVLLPGAVIFAYLLLTKRWGLLKEMRLVSGVPLFLLIAAPWFVLVSVKNPEFLRFFFIHEHFARYLTKVHHRYQPFWFFIPVLLGTMLPWSLFFPVAARDLWRNRRTSNGGRTLYLVLWFSVIFLFFSFSHSKLVPYILPVFPAAALLIGKTFSPLLEENMGDTWVESRAAGIFLLVLGAGIIGYPYLIRSHKIGAGEAEVIGGLLICQGLLILTVFRKSKAVTLFAALAALSCVLGICAPLLTQEDLAELKSSKRLGLIVRERAGNDAVVASYNIYQQGFSFYTRRRIVLVNEKNELEFGSAQGDQSAWFLNNEQFEKLWDSPVPVYALIKKSALEQFQKSVKTPVRTEGENGEELLISNARPRSSPPHSSGAALR